MGSGGTTLEVCEPQPSITAVLGVEYVSSRCLHVKLVVSEEAKSDCTIVESVDVRCQELGKCHSFHGGEGRRLSARDTVQFIDILYHHIECLWMEGLASSEYALRLRPW